MKDRKRLDPGTKPHATTRTIETIVSPKLLRLSCALSSSSSSALLPNLGALCDLSETNPENSLAEGAEIAEAEEAICSSVYSALRATAISARRTRNISRGTPRAPRDRSNLLFCTFFPLRTLRSQREESGQSLAERAEIAEGKSQRDACMLRTMFKWSSRGSIPCTESPSWRF